MKQLESENIDGNIRVWELNDYRLMKRLLIEQKAETDEETEPISALASRFQTEVPDIIGIVSKQPLTPDELREWRLNPAIAIKAILSRRESQILLSAKSMLEFKARYAGQPKNIRRLITSVEENWEDLDLTALTINEEEFLQKSGIDRRFLRQQMEGILGSLGKREREIVELAYGLTGEPELNNTQIAEVFKITPERVRQILAKVMMKMRHPKYSRKLRGYF